MEKWLQRTVIVLLAAAVGHYIWHFHFSGASTFPVAWRFNHVVFTAAMMLSIPATVILLSPFRILLGGMGGRIIWLVNPARTVAMRISRPPELVLQQAKQRLLKMDFLVEEEPSAAKGRLLFHRKKGEAVHSFIEHSFSGEVRAVRSGEASEVAVTLLLEETLVIETGELERMRLLAGYIGGEADELNIATLPFTLLCGVVLSLINISLLPFEAFQAWLVPHQLSLNLGVAGLILMGGYPIITKPKESYGWPLGLMGLLAALLPFCI